jgi:hypothetical protein
MPEKKKSGAKRFLILIGLFLLCLASTYGYGRWQGAKAVAGAQAEVAGVRESAAARAGQARSELTDLRGQVQMLQARRHLDRALMALDERNFGTAAEALHTAGSELAAVQPPPAGADPTVLARLAQEIQAARLAVSEDFSQQRSRILGWIRELDTQFPADPASAASASTPAEGSTAATGTAPATAPGADASTPPAPSAPAGTQ